MVNINISKVQHRTIDISLYIYNQQQKMCCENDSSLHSYTCTHNVLHMSITITI